MENKANLTNHNMQHHVQMDFDQIEIMIRQKQAMSGNKRYEYPGALWESDHEINAADKEDYVSSFKNSSSDNSYFDSDLESKCSWEKTSDNWSENSFDSSKLMDGYKDFVINQQRHQAKRAKQEAEKEAGKPR